LIPDNGRGAFGVCSRGNPKDHRDHVIAFDLGTLRPPVLGGVFKFKQGVENEERK
jgi:hypothetical protein